MSDTQPPDKSAAPGPERLGYFLVRVRRPATGGSGGFAGLVERLGTGEKRAFQTGDELARVVEEWSR